MPEIKCPDCGEMMEIERDWYCRLLSCPSCKFKFTPDEPKSPPHREDERPQRKRFRSREYEDRPQYGNKGLFIALGITGGLVLFLIVGCGILAIIWKSSRFTPGVTSAPSINWVAHKTPDGTTGIQFPQTPIEKPLGEPNAEVKITSYKTLGTNGKDVVLMMIVFDYETADEERLDEAIENMRDNLKNNLNAKILSDTTIKAYGIPIKEVLYFSDNMKTTTRFIKLMDRKKPRWVFLQATGEDLKEGDKKKFFDSFQFTAGKK